MSYVYNNVLFPADDILIEGSVDTSSGIKDNLKVLISKNNWVTKEDLELCDYRGEITNLILMP